MVIRLCDDVIDQLHGAPEVAAGLEDLAGVELGDRPHPVLRHRRPVAEDRRRDHRQADGGVQQAAARGAPAQEAGQPDHPGGGQRDQERHQRVAVARHDVEQEDARQVGGEHRQGMLGGFSLILDAL